MTFNDCILSGAVKYLKIIGVTGLAYFLVKHEKSIFFKLEFLVREFDDRVVSKIENNEQEIMKNHRNKGIREF